MRSTMQRTVRIREGMEAIYQTSSEAILDNGQSASGNFLRIGGRARLRTEIRVCRGFFLTKPLPHTDTHRCLLRFVSQRRIIRY